ncbi:hypothetical protein Pve01_15720 [Planomonospora venezuelensis]|nr:hypothetical protein Pve01_15720 [Planomonospora venezuelensis]
MIANIPATLAQGTDRRSSASVLSPPASPPADLPERYARAATGKGHECLAVNNDVDLRLPYPGSGGISGRPG